jgi:zinc protease
MKSLRRPIKKALAAIAVIVVVITLTLAQQRTGAPQQSGQSIKGADIKGRPVNKEILRVNLPKAREATLSNGLRVILLESHRASTFTMQMVILSGGLSDPADYHGLATFTAALLREGTATRKSKDIAEQMDTLGATLTSTSGLSSFVSSVSTSGLIENFDPALDVFADVIRNPTFPAEEVDKYKQRQISQLQFQRSLPQFLAAERFNRAIYGEHPAGLAAAPVESVKRATSADLARFHATYYRPNNAMLFIAGDTSLKEIISKLEKALGGWQRADVPQTKIPIATELGAMRIHLIDRPGSVQTVLVLGTLGIERTSKDHLALLVMNQILGGGPAARLFMNLREDKGYTYGAYSNFGGSKFRGVFLANSEVRTDVTEGAMKEFMYELNRMRDDKVSATEIENAKRALVGSFALSLEQPQALLQNIVDQNLYGMPHDYWEVYPQKIMAITADDVQRVAQKYIDLNHMQIVAVGDATKTRAVLAKFGTVEEYDADGKPVGAGKN